MNTIKLCLGSFALASLLAIILVTPANAFAQSGTHHTVQRPKASHSAACKRRALDQGSGTVLICG